MKIGNSLIHTPSGILTQEQLIDHILQQVRGYFNNMTLAGYKNTVKDKTASYSLSPSESGTVFTNLGSSGTISLTLPKNATTGTHYTFVVKVAQELRIVISAAAKKFYADGVITTDDGGADLYIAANDEGEHLTLMCDSSGDWFATNEYGTWTVTQP